MESKARGRNLIERETWETKCIEWESHEDFFFKKKLLLQLSYSAILYVELHCNTILKFFTIVVV